MKVGTAFLTLFTIAVLIAVPMAVPAQTRTADDSMSAVEGAKSPAGPNALGGLTISELMARFNVPGVSIAKEGQGGYFAHGGSNWGSQATFAAPGPRGYWPPVEGETAKVR